MKRIASLLLLAFSMLLSMPVMAGDLVAVEGASSVRLTNRPCASASVLAIVPAEYHDRMRTAIANLSGRHFVACWLAAYGQVHMVYEDGDRGSLSLSLFKEDKVL